MNNVSKLVLALGGTLLFISAHAIPNTNQPKTFLGPTLRAGFTSPLTDISAFNFAADLGLRNFRLGAVVGWQLTDNQRIKISGEYLSQKITYPFFSDNADEWVKQGALGADYQYEFLGYRYHPQADLDVYYAHTPSKVLGVLTGSYVNKTGIIQNFTDKRRLAGSNFGGASPGVSIQPWQGGKVGIALNYDITHYDKNVAPSENASGFGGTIHLNQALSHTVEIGASAAVRKPFNHYEADLKWNPQRLKHWVFGLDGDYTVGKNTLPNTYDVGLSVNYFMDQPCETVEQQRWVARKFINFKDEQPVVVQQPAYHDFLAWTADPAVHMPQVLTMTDDTVIIR